MLTESKIKKAAVLVALDISLKRMKNSPKRCARNIMELGLSAYPDKIPKEQQEIIFRDLASACEHGDINKAKNSFITYFLS